MKGCSLLSVSLQSESDGVEEERDKFPCGECGREVRDNDEAIYCESGCEQWYHRWVCPDHVIPQEDESSGRMAAYAVVW